MSERTGAAARTDERAPAAVRPEPDQPVVKRRRRPLRPARIVLHAFLILAMLGFLAPLALAVYASLRPYSETAERGYFSLPRHLTLDYYVQVLGDAGLPKYFLNTLYIAIPAVVLTLFLSSFVAFCIARLKVRGGLVLLVIFTAGNLLPPQILLTPLYQMYKSIPLPEELSSSLTLYDSYLGLVAIHVAFQVGFCVFVLSNYMRTIPDEITEAAVVDGAGAFRQYWQVTLPLCRPALAALATLEFTWIYNDFLYAVVLMSTGDKLPITSALNNLRGQFFTDYNLLAAGSVVVAFPTVLVFLLLQRHFIAGLTLGANKG
jgi:multiple sugar transport system permease protein